MTLFLYRSMWAGMDWALAIERNRQPLLRIVAVLCGMIGLGGGGAVARLSRPVYRAVLVVLRPAEAAVRRLIVVAARGIVVKPQARRPAPRGRIISSGTGQGRVAFQLFDPPRILARADERRDAAAKGDPRIRVIDVAFDPRIPLFRPITAGDPRSRRSGRRLIRQRGAAVPAACRHPARIGRPAAPGPALRPLAGKAA